MTDIHWQNIVVKLGDLKPWSSNPRMSTKAQAKRLLESWNDFGQVETIAVSPELNVYDGHQRLSALLTVYGKDYEVDARQSSRELTEDERRKLVVFLHSGAVGDWNWDELANWSASELVDWGMDEDLLKSWNADANALKEMLTAEKSDPADAEPQIDRAAELNEKWQVKTGDLWQIGEHRLLCGDSTVKADVERVMGGEKADMVFTDPPYNVAIVGGTHDPRDSKNFGMGPKIENDSMSDEEFDNFLNRVFMEMNNAIRNGAVYYVCAPAGRTETQFRNALDLIDNLQLRECIVWVKQQAVFGRQDYHWQHESILYGWKDGSAHYFCNDHTQTTLWNIDRPMRSDKEHPTQKPVELVQRAITNSSMVGDTLYEPFCGSGTTMVACENLHRKCRAIEISPNYCAVILERMQTAFPELEIKLIQ